jgi:HPt (histidine-containing phosphotransfer) domain-containing protein
MPLKASGGAFDNEPAMTTPEPSLLEEKIRPWAAIAFDASVIETHFCRDGELFAACRDIFMKQTPGRLEAIRTALARGDANRVHYLAHTLHGAAATLGANALAHACAALEEAAQLRGAMQGRSVTQAEVAFQGFASCSSAHAPFAPQHASTPFSALSTP